MTSVVTVGSPWTIVDDLAGLQGQFNRLFEDWGTAWEDARFPRMNTWVSENDLVLDVELPGVNPKEVDIAIAGNELTISGKRVQEPLADGETIHRQERSSGEFSRSVELPYAVDVSGTKAKYRHGVLRITLPRLGTEKPRKVQIEVT